MNTKQLNKVRTSLFEHCAALLTDKGKEYAEDHPDRLRAFKVAAELQGISPKAALYGMLAKHLVSVSDMCQSDHHYDRDRWTEKLTDSINYLVLLAAIVTEELEEDKKNG